MGAEQLKGAAASFFFFFVGSKACKYVRKGSTRKNVQPDWKRKKKGWRKRKRERDDRKSIRCFFVIAVSR